ncbi:MAG: CRISPR-associated endonuclease Cas4g/Cas1g, partial [Thermoanaerobaculum sp.]
GQAMETPASIPVRLLCEFAYCPRLAYLLSRHGEWEDNQETEEGRYVHRRSSQPEGPRAELPTRSLFLESPTWGLAGIVDLLERRGNTVQPVEYKRGKKPPNPEHSYEPERVQLCAQALLLRERGYTVHEGILYYAGSRDRVRIRITENLVSRTLELLQELRATLDNPSPPPPLVDSPKCPRCSLVGICLPEETNYLRQGGNVRPLAVAEHQRFPLYVQQPGATVSLDGERLVVHAEGKTLAGAGLETLSQVVLMGAAHITTPAIQACLSRAIPIVYLSGGGWFYGYARGLGHRNASLRLAQYTKAGEPEPRQAIVNTLIANKIANSRVLLRRNGKPPRAVLQDLANLVEEAKNAENLEALLGLEAQAARLYFAHFATMFKTSAAPAFDFEARTRRPPTDPVNALLSFLYTLLLKDWTITLETVGFDPFFGFLHAPRHGKPALALDLMEPYRPLVADSVAITVINNGEVKPEDFWEREGAYLLKPDARRTVVQAYQRRLAAEITHPVFGYKVSYRRLFEIQARLLARYLLGEIPRPPEMVVR